MARVQHIHVPVADLGICERVDAESGMVCIGILIVDDTGIRLKLLCKQQHRHKYRDEIGQKDDFCMYIVWHSAHRH